MKNSKKVITAMFALLILPFIAGCSNGNSSIYEHGEPAQQYPSEVHFTFENIEDHTTLTDVHEIDFRA
ncbi:MAG: hypothetical protein FWF81_01425 [Defluviitaleaceae bacterium]|nr:hypothetical protein [Defluviitaleaceae bacterium]